MSTPRPRPFVVLVVVLASLMGSAHGQPRADDAQSPCLPLLRRSLPSHDVSDAVMAVELLTQLVRITEPAFPALRGGAGPIAAGEDGADAARFLHRRYLLPDGWTPETHDDDAWREMLRAIAARYGAQAPSIVGTNRTGMIGDVSRTMAVISAALRPLAVFATGPGDRVTFFAVLWNWTPAPRLILLRPPEGLELGPGGTSSERAAPVLEAMSTCAIRFESFVFASEDVALRMFVQQGESIMRILESEPPRPDWPLVITAERVVDAFRFADPAQEGLDAMSVSIEGPSIGVGTALAVLAAVRTNLGLDGIFYHLAFP
jgi:hypothetical protein